MKNRNCFRPRVAGKLDAELLDEFGKARLLAPCFRGLVCCLVIIPLISCSARIAQPDNTDIASPDAGNPTLEPAPKEAIYSFDKAYRKRYGDEVVKPEEEGGDDQ